ncbi:MAG TPA: DedA family protein [Bacteroidota bacterium]|nr:DedA family protein [Bacteroidota bacterium]
MEFLKDVVDFVLHIDVHLHDLIREYGTWTYAILFLILFCETGLVVTPFLPGDSLLFAAGTFAATNSLNVMWLAVLLPIAAVVGDTVNYWIGWYLGPKIFRKEEVRFLNKKHLERTNAFYKRYGVKTIIFARFVPIIRTFAPFVAGIGRMTYGRFITYSVLGAICWVVLFVGAGYFFGNIPVVRQNFTFAILAIIIISTLPPVIEYIRMRSQKKNAKA